MDTSYSTIASYNIIYIGSNKYYLTCRDGFQESADLLGNLVVLGRGEDPKEYYKI